MPRQKIVIDPVTRIEGHAKISIHLDDQGHVEEAFFHVTQFRGFEKFCEGRPFTEMPSLMARICGICPVSHLIASAKACDAILAVRIPPNAARLRRIMNLAQMVQSHALSFFHLSSPDFLLGMDSDPAKRNIFGVAEAHPEMARDGVRLRQFGQQAIERLGGKRVHPAWVVAGGVNEPLSAQKRDAILAGIPDAMAIAMRALDWFKGEMEKFREEIRTFANFPTLFMALVAPTAAWISTTASCGSWMPGATSSPTESPPIPMPRTWARWSTPGRISRPPITSRWVIPMASTAWARWRGST